MHVVNGSGIMEHAYIISINTDIRVAMQTDSELNSSFYKKIWLVGVRFLLVLFLFKNLA